METNKAKATELAARVRAAAKQHEPVALAIVDLVKTSLEAAKESLVTADGNDMLRKQGAAQQLSKLLSDLTTEPPSIKPPGVANAP